MQNTKIITDANMQEMKSHGTIDFPFAYYYDVITGYDNAFIDWHWHSELEWVLAEGGTTHCLIHGEKIELTPGDGIFVNSNILHAYKASGTFPTPIFLFAPEFLATKRSAIYKEFVQPILTAELPYIVLKRDCPWQAEILNSMKHLKTLCQAPEDNNHCTSAPPRKLDIYIQALSMWQSLSSNISIETQRATITYENLTTQKRIQTMISFIKSNYAGTIKLEDIVQAASISKSEALRCFHTVLDTTPVDYLIRYRLDMATKLLQSTNDTITTIAGEVGFENPSYFCRAFRKVYNMSPAEYRKSVKASFC